MDTKQNKNQSTGPSSAKKRTRPRGEKLKAERVQEKLKAERVQEQLRSLPGWRLLQRGGRAIYREREFQDSEVASAFASFAGVFTAGMKQPATIALSESRVLVILHTRSRAGLSDAVLELAKSLG